MMGLCLLLAACTAERTDDTLLVFEMDKKYPTRTIDLRTIADVRYLELEATDESLYTRFFSATEHTLLCFGNEDGAYLFYDWEGHPLGGFSHQGQGPEEYFFFWEQCYDELADELFVYSFPERVQVYDRRGNYKRGFAFSDSLHSIPKGFQIFDAENLLIRRSGEGDYWLVSKCDGQTRPIPIPKMYPPKEVYRESSPENGNLTATFHFAYGTRAETGWYLSTYTNDTVYHYTQDHQLAPYFVRRPSAAVQETPRLVDGFLDTPDYQFFSVQEISYNYRSRVYGELINYLYDKREKTFARCRVVNPDFEGQSLIFSPGQFTRVSGNDSSTRRYVLRIDMNELQEALEFGRLHGELKALAERADVENPFILMIMDIR